MSRPGHKIFVGGLPPDCATESLQQYFEQFGTIIDCVVMMDRETGRTRGFGFVTYDAPEPLDTIMSMHADHKICDKWVDCKRATPEGSRNDSRKVGGGGAFGGGVGSSGAYGGNAYGEGGGGSYRGPGAGGGGGGGDQRPGDWRSQGTKKTFGGTYGGGGGYGGKGGYGGPSTYGGGMPAQPSYGAYNGASACGAYPTAYGYGGPSPGGYGAYSGPPAYGAYGGGKGYRPY